MSPSTFPKKVSRNFGAAAFLALVFLPAESGGVSIRERRKPARPGPDLEVELLPLPKGRRPTQIRPALLRFHNRGNKVLRLLKPLDGSTHGWLMPVYRFTVRDRAGAVLPLPERCKLCGLWFDTRWPGDYLVTIKPGGVYEVEMGLPAKVTQPGVYRVTFEYVFDPRQRTRNDLGLKYPGGLWVGTARSKDLRLPLR
jgi:hypothetical protein